MADTDSEKERRIAGAQEVETEEAGERRGRGSSSGAGMGWDGWVVEFFI